MQELVHLAVKVDKQNAKVAERVNQHRKPMILKEGD